VSRPDHPAGRRPNHLAGETSPYLLQHVHNPVDWHPWSPAALARARAEDRPIFLSIGYAACHWCHVMERESFEDGATAELLNRHFVPIKVDREERPDLDEIYMNAVQLMTGHGGWPLSVFLTPDLEPFMGGTYFPPEDRRGMPGFRSVLQAVHQAWRGRRGEVTRSAEQLVERLHEIARGGADAATPTRSGRREAALAAAELSARFEPRWGGFSGAPKFPPETSLALLLDLHARSREAVPLAMAEKTLESMARGGIHDHVGGGFARYSVDERWLVPHFEKMLYNQALLVPVYTDAWLLTRKPLYRRVALRALDFVRRELTAPEGGFYSSLDADSEGEEGKFYVWTPDQVRAALGADDARLVSELYDITPAGNFDGRSIPNLLAGSLAARAAALGTEEVSLASRLEPLLDRLLAARAVRVRPATDDKVLTAWNGLMIGACARAHQAFGRPEDLESARRAADFAFANLRVEGRLRVSWRAGQAKLNGYLDDYAFLARGLVDLYETAFDPRDLEAAEELGRVMLARFADGERGGFFFTSDDHEALLTRTRSGHDGALPSGAGVAAEVLLRLAAHTGADDLRAAAERALDSQGAAASRAPSAYASHMIAALFAEEPPVEIGIVGPAGDRRTRELLAVVRDRYRSRPVVQLAAPGVGAGRRRVLEGKRPLDGRPTAWVCRDYACRQPVTDPAELARELDDPRPGRI